MKSNNCLVFVPHQDDEMNVVGPIINEIQKEYTPTFVFMTNGGVNKIADIRIKESIIAFRQFGIKRDQIILLGYPDRCWKNSTHFWIDTDEYQKESNINCTEGSALIKSWHYLKTGREATLSKESFCRDIYDILIEKMPDVIYCVDYDLHCDHRVLSMAVEKALGWVLQEKIDYSPAVYKTYAYATMYTGENDFQVLNLPVSKFNSDKMCNPFLPWDERLRIPIRQEKIFAINPLARAYSKYVSQMAVTVVGKTINSDYVAWIRRTDNLLRFHCIERDEKYKVLWDFQRFSTTDIMEAKELCDVEWESDCIYYLPVHQQLRLNLDRSYAIENIHIFGRVPKETSGTEFLRLRINNREVTFAPRMSIVDINLEMGGLSLDCIEIENLSLRGVLLTEVEVFEPKPLRFEHFFLESENSADRTIYYSEKKIQYKLCVTEKYGRKQYVGLDDIDYTLFGDTDKILVKEDVIEVDVSCNYFAIKMWLKQNPRITWTTKFVRINALVKTKVFLIKGINYITHTIMGERCKYKRDQMKL